MYHVLWRSSGISNLQKEGNRFCTVINMLATTLFTVQSLTVVWRTLSYCCALPNTLITL